MKRLALIVSIIVISLNLNAQISAEPDTLRVSGEVLDMDVVPVDALSPDSVMVAPDALGVESIEAALLTIESKYRGDWTQLSMQGKLSMQGLPVRPTVKIYMERGNSIILSARAPFFGEVARVEACHDSITFINKHTKKFMSVDIRSLCDSHPTLLSDMQDILLGNVAYPGYGRLSRELASRSAWSLTSDNEIIVLPEDALQYGNLEYGYLLSPESLDILSFMLMLHSSDALLNVSYLYGGQGWTLGVQCEMKKQTVDCELQLSYPDYNPTPLQLTNAESRYTHTDLKGILKF